jgi:type I restriction enzyme R subunit
VLIDAVGVEKSCKTESRPLEKLPTVPLKDLMMGVAMGHRDEDTVLSLANRLVRLAKQLDDKAKARIEKHTGGVAIGELGKALIVALDPDKVVATAIANAKSKGISRTEDSLLKDELDQARAQCIASACLPFDKPELRDEIDSARREREQVIDHVNLDQVTFAGFSAQAETQAKKVIETFADYIKAHKDEIGALSFFYQQPYQRRTLTFDMIEELHDTLSRPPLMLTTERLWSAYARVQANNVKGVETKRQLTDLVSLIRFAIGLDTELKPFKDQVDKRFQEWIFRHNAQRATAFTTDQTEWLRLMKDHIASSCCITRDDFDYAEFANKGGLQKAWALFGKELDGVMAEMNEGLVA